VAVIINSVTPEPVRTVIEAHAPMIQMKSNFWSNWSYIAVDHTRTARRERDALLRDWTGEEKDATRMLAETNAALVAVAAVAFAVEAFHADVAPILGRSADTRVARGKQRGYVIDTFRHVIPSANRWQKELNWLFDLRDDEVHFIGEFAESQPHPALPMNVAKEHIRFSVESAERAVALLVRVWRDLFEGSKGTALEPWVRARRHVLPEFLKYVIRPPDHTLA
jgi:hypothetical protein